MTQQEQCSLIDLLERRFGDGSLYLRNDTDRQLLSRAVNLGLVSREGYLTAAGKRFVQTGTLDETPGDPEVDTKRYDLADGDGL